MGPVSLYCGKWRTISKLRHDLDLGPTMPNIELNGKFCMPDSFYGKRIKKGIYWRLYLNFDVKEASSLNRLFPEKLKELNTPTRSNHNNHIQS